MRKNSNLNGKMSVILGIFPASIGKKRYFFALGTIPETGVGFIGRKITACISSKHHQDICKVSKESELKTEGGVAHTRHPLSIHFHCQNTEKRLSSICKKSVKN